jgi:hypothetical protein
MARPKVALVTLLVLVGILSAVVAATYPMLPDRVASHFSAAGKPDGWVSRPAYAASLLAGAVAMAVVSAEPLYLARFLSDSLINIPHRDYWLAPERRHEAHDRLFAFGLWLACLEVALLIGIHALIVRAHQSRPVSLPLSDGIGLLAAFLIGVGGLCYMLCVRFWRIEPEG